MTTRGRRRICSLDAICALISALPIAYVLGMFSRSYPGTGIISLGTSIKLARPDAPKRRMPLPLHDAASAGFPSPAADHAEGRLDIYEHLVRRPAATFFCRAQGESMIDAGIHDGDLLVVDRSITAVDGDVVVVTMEGGLTVKRLSRDGHQWFLSPANPDFPNLLINPDEGIVVWGVVTYAITPLCMR